MDAGRHLHLDLLAGGSAALALAGLAGLVHDLAAAVADRAGGLGLHLAEDGALDLDHAAGAVAAVAGLGVAALGDAGAAAVVAGRETLVGDGLLAAGGRLGEGDPQVDAHVAAARAGLGAAAALAAEEGVEDVAEAKATAAEDVGDVNVVGAKAGGAVGVSVAVVVGALLVVGKDRIGLVDLLEALLGVRGVRDVRVKLAGKLQESALDGPCVRVVVDAEYLVVVLLRFQSDLSPTKAKKRSVTQHLIPKKSGADGPRRRFAQRKSYQLAARRAARSHVPCTRPDRARPCTRTSA